MTGQAASSRAADSGPSSAPNGSKAQGPRRKRPKWLLPTLIIASLGITAFAVLRPRGATTVPVNVVAAKTETLIKTVNGTGSAKAEVSRSVSFAAAGNVASVEVRVGDPVRAGQVLARLDTAAAGRDLDAARVALDSAEADLTRALAGEREGQLDLTRQVQAAETALSAAQATLTDTERALALQRELLAAGAASAQEVRTAQTNRDDAARKLRTAQSDLAYARAKGGETGRASVTQARAALEGARVRVQNLEKALADAELRSPTAGVVSAVNVTAGNPAPSNAIEITDPARLYLEVPFDETRAAELSVGQPAAVQFDAVPGRSISGTVDRVEPVARSSGQVSSVLVRIRLPPSRDVKPGFTGSATVTTRRLRDAVTIPLETTSETGGKTQVWRVQAQPGQTTGQASPVTISVLDRNANRAAVQGLQAGDLIITPAPTDLEGGAEVRFIRTDVIRTDAAAPANLNPASTSSENKAATP